MSSVRQSSVSREDLVAAADELERSVVRLADARQGVINATTQLAIYAEESVRPPSDLLSISAIGDVVRRAQAIASDLGADNDGYSVSMEEIAGVLDEAHELRDALGFFLDREERKRMTHA